MAENNAEPKAGSGLVKKLLIFGGGGLVLVMIGVGAGWLIFGGSQPDPSEEIEEIIERKMQEREAVEAEADNSTPQKMSKSPVEEVFETIYHEFLGLLLIFQVRARCCRSEWVFQRNMMTQ